jgi:hypothetical protein
MQHKSKSPFAAAKWILGVGLLLVVGVIALTSSGDKRKSETADASSSGAARSESVTVKPTQRGIAGEVPPWVAAQQRQEALPSGLVPASEINPPPPDPNAPLPPPPVEPPNPATHRP